MNVAWGLVWGESRSTKPSALPCKVAAAGDERYLVCAGCGLGSAKARSSPHFNGCFDVCLPILAHCSFMVLWNLCLQKRVIMAPSRLLGAAAACVILLSFAAGHRKSY